MKFSDNLDKKPTGDFHLEIYRGGKLIEVMDEKNLIVVGSQQTHAHLLGGDVTNRSVSQIGFGTNGTAPAFSDSALTTPYLKGVDSVSYPATNQVQFDFSLASGEANGLAIFEFGLLTTAGVLYARKVRSAVLNKGTDISLTGSWTINF